MNELIFALLLILSGALFVVIFPAFFRHGARLFHHFVTSTPKVFYKQLSALCADVFSCLLDPAYPENRYLYERRIHIQKSKCLEVLLNLKKARNDTQYKKQFDSIMACSQLRWRLSDYTALQVCHLEMKSLDQALQRVFSAMYKRTSPDLLRESIDYLISQIERLEENYHHVLTVTSKEPVVFLYFIYQLRQFCDQFELRGSNDD